MERRTFLGLAAAIVAVSPAAVAQQTGKVFRVGCLPGGPLAPRAHQWDAFRQALRELGWVEGRNIIIEMRPPAREGDPYEALVAELLTLKVDVIVATGSRALRAAMSATSTVPIVMSPSPPDPVREGFIASLARPGGNLTGSTIMAADLAGKRLEIFREALPKPQRIAVLWMAGNERELAETRGAAKTLGVELRESKVEQADDLEKALEAASRDRVSGVYLVNAVLFFGLRARISELALHHRLPTMFGLSTYVNQGGLMSYGPSDTWYYRRAAYYVDRILKGAKPADLPVEQPMNLELVVNLKTAKSLGLKIPRSLLLRADQIIE